MREMIKHLPKPDSEDLLERLRKQVPGSRWNGVEGLHLEVQGAEAWIFQRGGCLRYEQRLGRINRSSPMVKRLPGNGVKDHWAVDLYPAEALREQDVLACLADAEVALSAAPETDADAPLTDLAEALELLDSGDFAEAQDGGGFVHRYHDALQRQRELRLGEEQGYVVLETPVIRGAEAASLKRSSMRTSRRGVDAFCQRLNASYGPAFVRTDDEVLVRGVIPRSVGPAEQLALAVRRVAGVLISLHDAYFFPLVGLLDKNTARAVMALYRRLARARTRKRPQARRRSSRPVDRLERAARALAQ